MTVVFVGGSRSITHLPPSARERLDNIVTGRSGVVVGDAAGADSAVQRHFLEAGYRDVEVFASEGRPRHNLGDWPVRAVRAEGARAGFAFFAAKDRAMAEVADFGLMIWDGESPGTVLNILRLVRLGKKAVLIDVAAERSTTFRGDDDWRVFLAGCDRRLRASLHKRATPEEWRVRSAEPERDTELPGLAEPPAARVGRRRRRG